MELHEQLNTALELAVTKHHGQYDKIGLPYVFHPITVSLHFDSFEHKIVALLHDVLEDCDCSEGELLERGIDRKLVDSILAITRQCGDDNETYWRQVKTNKIATEVKLQDIYHNLSRLDHLMKSTQDRLYNKYQRALNILAD